MPVTVRACEKTAREGIIRPQPHDPRSNLAYLSAHPAGRHGFFTELVVRQGVDPVTAAKAGRWSDRNLPMRIYAHAETDEAAIRARFRTKYVQAVKSKSPNKQKKKKEIKDE